MPIGIPPISIVMTLPHVIEDLKKEYVEILSADLSPLILFVLQQQLKRLFKQEMSHDAYSSTTAWSQ